MHEKQIAEKAMEERIPYVRMLQDLQKTHPERLSCSLVTQRAFFFSSQLAATFHSVRLMSDTKACLSCEIPVLVTCLFAGASHGDLPPCWKVLTAHA